MGSWFAWIVNGFAFSIGRAPGIYAHAGQIGTLFQALLPYCHSANIAPYSLNKKIKQEYFLSTKLSAVDFLTVRCGYSQLYDRFLQFKFYILKLYIYGQLKIPVSLIRAEFYTFPQSFPQFLMRLKFFAIIYVILLIIKNKK